MISQRLPLGVAASVGALLGTCTAIGYATSNDPVVAALLVAGLLTAVVFALAGVARFTAIAVATLPWLVMLSTLIPRLTLTFASAAGALLLVSMALQSPLSSVPRVGVAMFLLILLVGVITSTSGDQLIEAAKYSLLPAMVLVVSSRSGRKQLVAMRSLLLCSGVAAMAAQKVIVFLHLGATSTKYGAGEQLGFAFRNPHELALVGTTVAVGCLVSVRDIRWRIGGAVIAVAPALATGVRSALVGMAIALLVLAFRARFRPSFLFGVGVLCAAVIVSGAGTIIASRHQQNQTKGEFSSFATTGSGRGSLWTAAIDHWSTSGARQMVLGNGLRSIQPIEAQSLFLPNATAQSDPVTMLVELGIIGLAGWLLIWLSLVRSRINWLVLVPLATYAIINGSLEYVGATVFCIALAGACTPEKQRAARSESSGPAANSWKSQA